MPKTRNANLDTMSSSDKLRELSRGVTILKDNHQIAACCRIACDLQSHLYGFPVIMPLYLATHTNGRRSLVPGHRMVHHLGSAVRRHRIRQCVLGPYGRLLRLDEPDALVGLLALRARYSLPCTMCRSCLGTTCHLCMCAPWCSAWVFPLSYRWAQYSLLWNLSTKGAAVSAHNLASGLTTFCGPFLATVLLNTVGFAGVCWAYAICYISGSVISFWIRPSSRHHPQSGGELSGAR